MTVPPSVWSTRANAIWPFGPGAFAWIVSPAPRKTSIAVVATARPLGHGFMVSSLPENAPSCRHSRRTPERLKTEAAVSVEEHPHTLAHREAGCPNVNGPHN